MCGLTLAWVTCENSTKQLECRHLLTRSSSLDPIYSATVPESTASVRGSTPTLLLTRLSAVPSPTAYQLLCPANSLSRLLTTSGYGEISGPKILWFRAETDKGIVCSGHPYSATQGSIPGRVIPKIQKIVLDASLLNIQRYKVGIKSNVEQSRERSSAPPTSRKRNLRVAFDYCRQIYNFTYQMVHAQTGIRLQE